MPLAPGTRIGPYEIAAPIGAGGMGEVYRATDTNLRRQVALKVLPASLASDPERLARFRREAEVLAALNHPNIAQIHGIEIARVDAGPEVTAGAIHALVMELVEGETLAERIARGPVPLDDAVPLARQIADALAAAHERGIVHRDLKPANVKVRPDGTLKVLDFGLAKASAPAEASVVGTSLTPTITTPAMVTVSGVILGTAAYMSPEQARGKPVDKSADVWAFGVVLWEMLTGRRLFAGDTVSDTIAAVLRQEPAWEDIPERLRPVLRLCLQKEPRHRLRDIGDARILLDEAVAGRAALPVAEAARDSQPLWRRALPLAAAALVTAVVVGGTAWTWRRPALGALTHLAVIHPPPEMIGGNDFDDNIAIAPDGRSIAYVAAEPSASSNTLRLYLRALDRPTPVLLTATARAPFFSPDGQWVGFVENNQRLSKVPVAGGPVVPIGGRVNAPRGVSWGDDDTIVYATADLASGLMRIAASGGEAQALTTVDRAKGELDHVFPQVLPAARGVLFAVTTVADGSQVAV